MKHYYIFLFAFLVGCSSDLDINSGHPAVPVVYAIINPYDTVHFVNVQKTFIITTKEDWSKFNPDSLQFRDVEVFLYGKAGNTIKWVEQFSQTTTVKDNGFFPSGNYQTFKLDHALPIKLINPYRDQKGQPDIDSLILEVRIHDMDLITRAAAKVLLPANIINYKSRNLIHVYGSYPSVYDLSDVGETQGVAFKNAYQQIDFRVHYKEYYKYTFAVKEISWMANTGWEDLGYFMTPTRLFNPMKLLLQKNDSLIARSLDSIDIELLKPSRFFNDYWFVREHWENSDRPPYTNFDHSYGMFFTIAKDEWTGMLLNWEAMDSLCNGFFYKEMKFKK